eukprot:TRINITY_DN18870_c0_g1_i2.p1 TRINITY_DN18870_c0_g1~~TRINITY_DN18870_c0_g1_i2.p1  ORF type:complete len:1063 (+),score=307.76 TRINITY_DN18870_c0_g1_i2:86-3190(+)
MAASGPPSGLDPQQDPSSTLGSLAPGPQWRGWWSAETMPLQTQYSTEGEASSPTSGAAAPPPAPLPPAASPLAPPAAAPSSAPSPAAAPAAGPGQSQVTFSTDGAGSPQLSTYTPPSQLSGTHLAQRRGGEFAAVAAAASELHRALAAAAAELAPRVAWRDEGERLAAVRGVLCHCLCFPQEEGSGADSAHVSDHHMLLFRCCSALVGNSAAESGPQALSRFFRDWGTQHRQRHDGRLFGGNSAARRASCVTTTSREDGERMLLSVRAQTHRGLWQLAGAQATHSGEIPRPWKLWSGEVVHILCPVQLLHDGQFIPCYFVVTDARVAFLRSQGGPPIAAPVLALREATVYRQRDSKGGESGAILELNCKNAWLFNIRLDTAVTLQAVATVVSRLLPSRLRLDDFFCLRYPRGGVPHTPTAEIVARDMRRVMENAPVPAKWRISDANRNFSISPTMPEQVVVPAAVSDEDVRALARFRIKRRFPMISWVHPREGTALARAGQPAVGLANRRSSTDEALMQMLRRPMAVARTAMSPAPTPLTSPRCSPRFPESAPYGSEEETTGLLAVVDARHKANAMANLAKGGGYIGVSHYDSCRQVNANVGNIHAMSRSLRELKLLLSGRTAADEENWLQLLHATQWTQHLQRIMQVSVRVVQMLDREGTSVLVHCTNGWDRTSQIVTLAMLLCDPHYRTIEGFAALIERDWVAAGHKFAERLGIRGANTYRAKGVSPIFLQWVDCVWQLTNQFPNEFQFSGEWLHFVATAPWDARIGSFLADTPQARIPFERRTMSFTDLVSAALAGQGPAAEEAHSWRNPFYAPSADVLYPSTHPRDLRLWTDHHCYVEAQLHPSRGGVPGSPRSPRPAAPGSSTSSMAGYGGRDSPPTGWRTPPTLRPGDVERVRDELRRSTGTLPQGRRGSMYAGAPTPDTTVSEEFWDVTAGSDTTGATDEDAPQDESPTAGLRAEPVRWFPDHLAPVCHACRVQFTFFLRRHHCRACGHVFCGDCSAQKIPVLPEHKDPVRVCGACFSSLSALFDPT